MNSLTRHKSQDESYESISVEVLTALVTLVVACVVIALFSWDLNAEVCLPTLVALGV